MKKRIINIFLIIIAIFSILNIGIIYSREVKADSGFDTSYDSGSYSSGYSGSDSSWSSNDSYRDRNSSSGEASLEGFLIVVIIVIIMFVSTLIQSFILENESEKKRKSRLNSRILTDDEVHNLDPSLNIQKFKTLCYESFIKIQNAWMDFDYDTLRKELTDELFNTYKMQLETLKTKCQKNIMKDFKLENVLISSIKFENNIESIDTILRISFKDYIVDEDNNVVRGNKVTVFNMEYTLTFIRTIEVKDNKCPKCGNELNNQASVRCEYCGSVVISNKYDFVLSKKVLNNQSIIR